MTLATHAFYADTIVDTGIAEVADALALVGEPDSPTPVNWTDSRFEAIDIGQFGEELVRVWALAHALPVEDSTDTVYDLIIDGRRVEVKTARARRRGQGGTPAHEWYAVYPHTADIFYFAAIWPERVQLLRASGRAVEGALGARHKLTDAALRRAGATTVLDVAVPRR